MEEEVVEQNPNEPERPGLKLECPTCGEDFYTQDRSVLYLFLHPAHARFSFIDMYCDNLHQSRQFVDIEDVMTLSGQVADVVVQEKVPDEIRDYLKEQWKGRMERVGMAPVEQEVEVIEVETWDMQLAREIEYAEPYEYMTLYEYKKVYGQQ